MTATESQQERIETLLNLKSNHIEQLEVINQELEQLGYTEFKTDEQLSNMLIESINQILEVNIRMRSRKGEIVKGRQFYYSWMKDNTILSLKSIGQKLFIQDHSTVINAIKNFNDRMQFDKKYRLEYEMIMANFKNKLKSN
jgi:chromosomal replication initiation ATPase DnaA